MMTCLTNSAKKWNLSLQQETHGFTHSPQGKRLTHPTHAEHVERRDTPSKTASCSRTSHFSEGTLWTVKWTPHAIRRWQEKQWQFNPTSTSTNSRVKPQQQMQKKRNKKQLFDNDTKQRLSTTLIRIFLKGESKIMESEPNQNDQWLWGNFVHQQHASTTGSIPCFNIGQSCCPAHNQRGQQTIHHVQQG